MTKKIIGFTIVFLFTSVIVSAQTRTDYVELIAADTIQLRAVSLEYTLLLNEYEYSNNYDEFGNVITNTHDIFADMRALKEKLNRAGFIYEHITSSGGYELPRQNQGAGKLLFKFKDKNDVIKLMDAVADVKFISGNMTRIDYEPMTDAMTQRLYSKVYNQAVKTATMMATASKQKLGELISVVDLKGDPSASSNIFSNMFSSFGRGANSENDSMVSSSTQTCKFRFELVD